MVPGSTLMYGSSLTMLTLIRALQDGTQGRRGDALTERGNHAAVTKTNRV